MKAVIVNKETCKQTSNRPQCSALQVHRTRDWTATQLKRSTSRTRNNARANNARASSGSEHLDFKNQQKQKQKKSPKESFLGDDDDNLLIYVIPLGKLFT